MRPFRPLSPIPARAVALAASLLTLAALSATPTVAGHGKDEFPLETDALMHGTWDCRRVKDENEFWINLRNETASGSYWSRGLHLTPQEVAGLPRPAVGDERAAVDLRVKRDAGTIHLTGEFTGRMGGGTFELELDPAFPAQLERRGVGRPSEVQQARLLLAGVDFGLLDALKRERYETPSLGDLVTMADHGVNERYVTGMARAGYRLESLEALVKARDHGVDPSFVEGMAEAGYRNLPYEMLLRARDHGADPGFAADMAEAGYRGLPLETLIRARDHGVDGTFVEGLRRVGFGNLSLEAVIRARDHGVTANYAKRVRAKSPEASLDHVIAMRDRGLSP